MIPIQLKYELSLDHERPDYSEQPIDMFIQRFTMCCCIFLLTGCAVRSSMMPSKQIAFDRATIPINKETGQDLPNQPQREQAQSHSNHAINLVSFARSLENQQSGHQPDVTPQVGSNWLVLTPDEAVCRALRTAGINQITQQEKEVVRGGVSPLLRLCYQSQIELAENLIDSVADGEKQKLALTVLQLYYGLAEIHAQADVMRRSHDLLDKLQLQVQSIIEADIEELRSTISLEDVQRRRFQLAQEQAVLEATGKTLTTQLNVILGLDDGAAIVFPIWTCCELAPSQPVIDLAEATDLALRCRKDLHSLKKLSVARSRDISAIGRVAAAQFHPSFGEFDVPPNSTLSMLSSMLNIRQKQDESMARREQVKSLLNKMEKATRTEIARNVYDVEELVKKIGLQALTVQSWNKQEQQMKAKRQIGKASFEQLLEPKVEGLKAESELYHLTSSLEIAMAKLRMSQGVLIYELFKSGSHQCQVCNVAQPEPINVANQFFILPDENLHQVLLEQR